MAHTNSWYPPYKCNYYELDDTNVIINNFLPSYDQLNSLIQKAKGVFDGIIINAAGYTHTSVAILDALLAIKLPVVEVHITNIYNREDFRKKSLISEAATGIICGFGIKGYIMALSSMKEILNKKWK